MSEPTTGRQEYVQELKAERDALKLKLHLVSMDLKDELNEEWQKVEHKWAQLKAGAKRFGHEVQVVMDALEDDFEEVVDNVEDAGETILKDIQESYHRIRDRLS